MCSKITRGFRTTLKSFRTNGDQGHPELIAHTELFQEVKKTFLARSMIPCAKNDFNNCLMFNGSLPEKYRKLLIETLLRFPNEMTANLDSASKKSIEIFVDLLL